MPRGFNIPSQLACEIATTVQCARPLRGKLANANGSNYAQQASQSFFPIPPHQPETGQRQCEMQLCGPKRAFLYIPRQSGAKVFMFGIEALQPFALCWAGELFFGGLAEIQEEMQEPRLDGVYFARLTKPVGSVLANCFQHAVARRSFALLENEQRLIHQSAHRIENVGRLQIRTFANGLCRFQRKAAVKQRKPPEQNALEPPQQVIAPINSGAEGLVPRQSGSATAGQQ